MFAVLTEVLEDDFYRVLVEFFGLFQVDRHSKEVGPAAVDVVRPKVCLKSFQNWKEVLEIDSEVIVGVFFAFRRDKEREVKLFFWNC